MKFETKKGMLVFSKQHSIIYFILSVGEKHLEEFSYLIDENEVDIDGAYSKFYEEYYDWYRIYHNGELK